MIEPVLTKAADILITVVLLKGTLLLLAGVASTLLLRRVPAGSVSRLGLGAIIGLFALPLIPLLVPGWSLAVVAFPERLFDEGIRLSAATSSPVSIATVLGIVWLAGVAILLTRLVVHRLRAGLLAQGAAGGPDGRAEAIIEDVAGRLGVTAPVRVVYCVGIQGPAMFGWRRPTIILPHAARHWPEAQLRSVLCHELAHVRRRDYPVTLFAEIMQALYWPNPLVWMLGERLRFTQDRACDDMALGTGLSAAEYARHLLEIARCTCTRRQGTTTVLPFVLRSRLRDRIRAVLDVGAARPTYLPRRALSAAILGLALLAFLGTADPWSCPFGQPHTAPAASSVDQDSPGLDVVHGTGSTTSKRPG